MMRMLRETREEQHATSSRLAVLRQDLDAVEQRTTTRAPATSMPPPPPVAPAAAEAAPSSAPAAQPFKRQRKEKGQYVREQTAYLVNLCVIDYKVADWKEICKNVLQEE